MHTYLLYVLGSAMGLKAACTMQRVLVYTREHHEHKAFFALARWEREGGASKYRAFRAATWRKRSNHVLHTLYPGIDLSRTHDVLSRSPCEGKRRGEGERLYCFPNAMLATSVLTAVNLARGDIAQIIALYYQVAIVLTPNFLRRFFLWQGVLSSV